MDFANSLESVYEYQGLRGENADDQPTRAKGQEAYKEENQYACAEGSPTETGCVHTRLYLNA